MKKMLITGFEPFENEDINPSWEAVWRLPDQINEYKLTKVKLPVLFSDAADYVISVANEIGADVIICVGQAGGRSEITPELVGINLRFAQIPDNNGYKPEDEPIKACGKNAYFSTLPVRKMVEAIKKVGIPSKVSCSAGTYVCNDVLYTLLAHFENTATRVGFIHVPYCTEQGKEPSMEIETILKGLCVAIECI